MKFRFLSMVRFVLLGALFSLWSVGAQALGVGEIELNSHLNQKLVAEIPLIDAAGLRADEVLVSLGTSEDFERAGVERFFYLTDLRFEVFVDGRGPRIRVTSRQPVTEPYLNFIVEVLWPNGRMLKEFTLLLDPPTYEAAVDRPDAGTTPSEAQSVPDMSVTSTPTTTQSAPAETSAYTRPESGAPPTPPAGGVNTTGQTLWGIAERYNPDRALTVGQYMLAIQRKNPEAFIAENINRMRGGVELQMPAAEEARQMSPSEAAAEVARQTDAWRGVANNSQETTAPESASEIAEAPVPAPAQDEPELRAQVDASTPSDTAAETTPEATAATAPTTGRLEIVGDTGDTGSAQSPAANADVTVLQEENQRLERQVQELGYQSDREKELAASEIAVKDRQLEVKDQQLAELRKQLEDAQAQLADRQGQPSVDQSQPDKPWWQSTMVLLAAALIVVLAIAGALVMARRRKSAAADVRDVETSRIDARVEPASGTSTFGGVAKATVAQGGAASTERAMDDLDTFEFLDDTNTDRPSQPDHANQEEVDAGRSSPSLQTSDVISEADIYAAYGRYPHAIGLLLGALDDGPDRHDVRLKLLEVAVSANDAETFERHIQELVDRCDDQDILMAARELEESFTGGAVERTAETRSDEKPSDAPSDELFAGDDDFSIDIDDDPISRGTNNSDEDDFLLELDDSHDPDAGLVRKPTDEALSARSVVSQEEYRPVATLDDPDESRADVLGGDLGIDFDDAELIEEKPPVSDARSGARANDDLDLDDDLDIDDLLADLDSNDAGSSPLPPKPLRAAEDDVRFSRAASTDDVPLLDSSDTVSADDLLAGDDDAGIEDLDDLLADLDEVEERSVATSTGGAGAPKSAEILSFNRPRTEDSNRTSVFAENEDSEDDGFDFGTAEDAAETKLDLAQAYIEMGDSEGAQDILNEVLSEGNPAQRQLAKSLLDSLAS